MQRTVGLVAASVLLVGVGTTITISTSAIGELSDEIDGNLQRIDAWDDLDGTLVELDAGEREYAYTGDVAAEAQFTDALARLRDAETRVRLTVDGNAGDVSQLLASIDAHVATLQTSIAQTHASGFDPLRARAAAIERRTIVKAIRGRIDELDDHADRWRTEQRKSSRALWIVRFGQVAGLVVGVGLLVLCFRSLRREVARRQASEGRIAEALHALEPLVAERTAELSAANAQLQQEVADRVRAEAQLRQAQKLEGIGLLAGGIAHDFNNLLSVIISYADLLGEDLADADHCSYANEISRAGMRAADMTRQLLAFSRRQVLAPKVLDLHDVITGIDKMLRRLIGEHIDLRWKPGELGKVEIDPGQLEQVVVNLVVNARDAMPAGGCITIETATVELDAAYASRHAGIAPGPHAMLAISDTGVGMDAATLERIFEPFFTTKEPGKGTGLGLSTVFGIVQQSRGAIGVESTPGAGTTFRLYFPIVAAEPAGAPRVRKSLSHVAGNETILLVEDEATVRRLVSSILGRAGYKVVEATDGEQALEVWNTSIALVVSDVVMPRMSGRVMAEHLRARGADVRILFMSGYTDDMVVRHGVTDQTIDFIQKPITQQMLLERVRKALDEPRARAA
jgi:signal transduction histidine kinase/ActR/RegA family two-component response regulator